MVSTTYRTLTESASITATAGGASGDVLYTCPARSDAEVDMLFITNGGTATAKITIEFYHADDTAYHNLVNSKSISGNDTFSVLDNSILYLHAGDKIVVHKDSGATFDVTISAKEFYNPFRIT